MSHSTRFQLRYSDTKGRERFRDIEVVEMRVGGSLITAVAVFLMEGRIIEDFAIASGCYDLAIETAVAKCFEAHPRFLQPDLDTIQLSPVIEGKKKWWVCERQDDCRNTAQFCFGCRNGSLFEPT